MKKYTQKEFDNFEIDKYGYKICPSGDYSLISNFGEQCSFGECCSFDEECSFGVECSFGERCSFGGGCSFGGWCSFSKQCSFDGWCSFGEHCRFGERCVCEFGEFKKMSTIGGFGSESRTTYFFKLTNGEIGVRCGCFAGNLNEFREKVKETHGESKMAKEYLMAADLMEYHFREE